MHRIPHEILREIFSSCLPEMANAFPSNRQAPLNVLHTCRYWRDIVISTRKLWSRLKLNCNPPLWYRDRNSVRLTMGREIIAVWLVRSRNAPLDYEIDLFPTERAGSDDPEDQYRAGEQILMLLFQQQKRWRRVRICCGDLLVSPYFGLRAAEMPLAESLDFDFSIRARASSNTFKEVDVDISTSPQLRQLVLHVPARFSMRGVLARNLTSCSLTFGPSHTPSGAIDVCSAILQLSPNLESLSIQFYTGNEDEDVPTHNNGERIVMRRLLVLDTFGSPGSVLIGKLILPSLKKLSVDEVSANGVPAGQTLVGLLRRSQSPLEELSVGNDFAEEHYLILALGLVPTLQSLVIQTGDFSHEFWIALTIFVNGDDAPEALCTQLVFMKLYCTEWGEDFEYLVARMLTSRWDHTTSFRKASLRGITETSKDKILADDAIRRCVSNGLILDF